MNHSLVITSKSLNVGLVETKPSGLRDKRRNLLSLKSEFSRKKTGFDQKRNLCDRVWKKCFPNTNKKKEMVIG